MKSELEIKARIDLIILRMADEKTNIGRLRELQTAKMNLEWVLS